MKAVINSVSKRQVVKMSANFFFIKSLPFHYFRATLDTKNICHFDSLYRQFHSIIDDMGCQRLLSPVYRTEKKDVLSEKFAKFKRKQHPTAIINCSLSIQLNLFSANAAMRRQKTSCMRRICRYRCARVCNRCGTYGNICTPCTCPQPPYFL